MIYLNNTATSFPKPPGVEKALNEFYKMPPCHSSRTGMEEDSEDVTYSCRSNLAQLLNAPEPMNFVFTSGSTEALNLAIKGLNLQGSHVVTTQIEHNSVIRPLKTLEQSGGITIDFAECDNTGYVAPEKIEELIRPETRAVVVNHCSNVTGARLDIKSIAEAAHRHNAVIVVDASQSAGYIAIDLKDWEIDYLAFTGHKNLYGMPGIGGLYMKEAFSLEPLKTGGTGVKSEVLVQPREMPMYYEAGTPNLPGIVSLNAGVEFILETGLEIIAGHKAGMVRRMIEELKDLEEIRIYTSYINNSLSNFCFNLEGMVPEEVNYVLESSFEIQVRSGLHCAPLLLKSLGVYPWGTVRCSPSYFTTDEEIDTFIRAIKEIAETFLRRKKKKN